MARIFYTILVGLVGAALIHIIVLLMIPSYAKQGLWQALAGRAELYQMVPFDATEPGQSHLPGTGDPLFTAIACRFDLEDGPLHLQSEKTTSFWSLSIRNPAGLSVYSLNERVSRDGKLDIVILTEQQMDGFKTDLDERFSNSILIETELGDGIAVLRAFQKDQTVADEVASFLKNSTCEPI